MPSISIEPKVSRGSILYARVQKTNKEWLQKKAKVAGYDSDSEYIDKVITKLRQEDTTKLAKTKATVRAKTKTTPKKALKKAKKK